MNSEPNRNKNSTNNNANREKKTRYYTIIQWIFIFSKLLAPELIDDRNLETENAQKRETRSTLTNKNYKIPFAGRPWTMYYEVSNDGMRMWVCGGIHLKGVFVCKFSCKKRQFLLEVISLWGFYFGNNIIHRKGFNILLLLLLSSQTTLFSEKKKKTKEKTIRLKESTPVA